MCSNGLSLVLAILIILTSHSSHSLKTHAHSSPTPLQAIGSTDNWRQADNDLTAAPLDTLLGSGLLNTDGTQVHTRVRVQVRVQKRLCLHRHRHPSALPTDHTSDFLSHTIPCVAPNAAHHSKHMRDLQKSFTAEEMDTLFNSTQQILFYVSYALYCLA